MKSSKGLIGSSMLATCLLWVAPNCVAQSQVSQNSAAPQPTPATATSTVFRALVPYAAIAIGASGQPLQGQLNVTFQLYQDEQGGEPLWSETQTVTFDVAGHYNVQLGSTLPNGVPVEVFSSRNARWLDAQIVGQRQRPRVLLTSVPYAFKSVDTSTLGGLPASAFVHADPAASTAATVVTPLANAATTTGKVTSVGLSAPSSDFKVTGSPVTSSGTLGLQWATPPASGNAPNSMIKRDATGSFAAGAVSVNQAQGTGQNNYGVGGVSAENGVLGSGVSQLPQRGVAGLSSGSGPVSDGVHGVTSDPTGEGVSGIGLKSGVMGEGGIGVFGTGSDYGFLSSNNVAQDMNSGGWIKAMAFINADTAPYSIVRCFNSTLPHDQATTPPCGLALDEEAEEQFLLTFNFDISSRFFAATLNNALSDVDLDLEPAGSRALLFQTYRGVFVDAAGAEYTVVVF